MRRTQQTETTQSNGHRPHPKQPPTNNRRPQRQNDLKAGFGRFMDTVALVATLPIQLYEWITRPPGSAIILGAAAAYMLLLSAESYWLSMGDAAVKVAFLPKPFIADRATLANLPTALLSGSFWIASLVSLVVQGIQAFTLREPSPQKARERYEAVAQYEVPDRSPQKIELAEELRLKYKQVGMRTVRQKGAVIFITYVFDIFTATRSYPLIGLEDAGELFTHAVWVFLAVFGAEIAINLFRSALDEAHRPQHPKTEVLP
jgi:hypothetical protein